MKVIKIRENTAFPFGVSSSFTWLTGIIGAGEGSGAFFGGAVGAGFDTTAGVGGCGAGWARLMRETASFIEGGGGSILGSLLLFEAFTLLL